MNEHLDRFRRAAGLPTGEERRIEEERKRVADLAWKRNEPTRIKLKDVFGRDFLPRIREIAPFAIEVAEEKGLRLEGGQIPMMVNMTGNVPEYLMSSSYKLYQPNGPRSSLLKTLNIKLTYEGDVQLSVSDHDHTSFCLQKEMLSIDDNDISSAFAAVLGD